MFKNSKRLSNYCNSFFTKKLDILQQIVLQVITSIEALICLKTSDFIDADILQAGDYSQLLYSKDTVLLYSYSETPNQLLNRNFQIFCNILDKYNTSTEQDFKSFYGIEIYTDMAELMLELSKLGLTLTTELIDSSTQKHNLFLKKIIKTSYT